MIPTPYRDTCTIKRRQATTKYGGSGADIYDVYSTETPCHYVEREGHLERQEAQGRNIIYTGVLILDDEVLESDLVVVNDIEYKVLRVQPIRDFVTGVVNYYRVYLERTAAVDVDAINAEPVINL